MFHSQSVFVLYSMKYLRSHDFNNYYVHERREYMAYIFKYMYLLPTTIYVFPTCYDSDFRVGASWHHASNCDNAIQRIFKTFIV